MKANGSQAPVPVLPAGMEAAEGGAGGRTWRLPRLYWMALLALEVVLVAAAAAYGAALLIDPRYAARADLVYEPGEAAASEPQAERMLATQVVALRSRAVLDPVATGRGMDARELEQRVAAEVLEDSQVIQLTVVDTDRERALAVAGDIVERYAGTEQPADAAAVDGQVAFLQGEIDDLSARQALAEEELAELDAVSDPDAPPGPEQRRLEAELEGLRRRLDARESRLLTLELERTAGPGLRVLSPPYLLPDPLWPRPLQAVAAGVLVGVVLAAALLLVLHRLGRPARW